MNAAELHARATEEFGRRVAAIADDQWHLPTPDTEWDVRMLVNHLQSEQVWVPPLVTDGLTVPEVGNRFDGDLLGDDPHAAWELAAKEAVAAFSAPGALERTVHLSSRDDTVERYAHEVACDLIIHSWDLAKAIGADDAMSPDLVEACWEIGVPIVEEWRAALGDAAASIVAAVVPTADDAELQTRLLAVYGRNRSWTP